jgi:hypothetical protein
LLDASWSAGQLYLGVGLVVLIAAVAIGFMRPLATADMETTSQANALETAD